MRSPKSHFAWAFNSYLHRIPLLLCRCVLFFRLPTPRRLHFGHFSTPQQDQIQEPGLVHFAEIDLLRMVLDEIQNVLLTDAVNVVAISPVASCSLKAVLKPAVCNPSRDFAVILDARSRKVVGWALDRTLANRLTVAALKQAIAQRRPQPGLVHHSDRGLQYARGEYVAILEQYGMVPSMSRPANPYDNASCESFMKTLKREEIYANRYDNLEHLRRNIEEFIEQYYNRQRLHSALGYRSPEEFEQQNQRGNSADSPGATMQFFANEGNGENEKRISPEVSGKEDSNAVLFPRPLLLLGDATKAE